MADRTRADETMSREEVASYLMRLADELERGEERIDVEVGNKAVTLSPAAEIDIDVEVVERASKLRGSRETIDIELSWKP